MFYKLAKSLFEVFNPRERRQAVLILVISLLSALLDAAGIASILPFMTVATNSDTIHSQPALAWIYQTFGFSQPKIFLLAVGGMSLFIFLLAIGFRAFATWANLRFVLMREFSISQRLLALYLAQPYSWFLNRHGAELSKLILSEVSQLTHGVITPLISLATNLVLAVAMIVLAAIVEPTVTLILLVVLGLSYVVSYKLSNRRLAEIAQQRFEANQMRFHLVSEILGAVKDLKAAGQERAFTQKYDIYAELYASKYVHAQIVAQTPRFVLEAIIVGGSLVVLLYFLAGSRSLVDIVPTLSLFVFAGYRLIPALQAIFGSLVSLKFNSPSLNAIHLDFFSLRHEEPEINEDHPNLTFNESLVMDKVSVCYPNMSQPALRKISLDIRAGTSLAIVGSTGSGKTTLVDSILGLLTPKEGQILIDGTCLSVRTLSAWQKQVGYVSQQVFLLDDSIAANIAIGVADKDLDKLALVKAARQALIHDFIVSELPQGYKTKVGERGVRLSGGQRQRLGIARALYRNPRLLIFDESTNALDRVTESEVMTSLNYMRGQVTVIMIAHRMDTVRHFDHVVLLEQGAIKSQGHFHELVQTCPAFRKLNEVNVTG